ncbi:NUP37 [Bugula neritina]|uniref:NUP37 n=1 Tax=Bugula neritina TaxID=10212 RepID=A0A7J7K065_BUGNE|nr:NUP37 [Bugula neritina]
MNSGESTSQLVPCTGVVSCVQCSPYEHCSSLLCYASHVSTDAGQTTHHIGIAQTHPKENSMLPDVRVVKEFEVESMVTCLALSPRTHVESLPYEVVICAGTIDGKVNIVVTDLRESNDFELLGEHHKAVNGVSFDNETGELLATVGDDNKCNVWNTLTGEIHCKFPLNSAGVDVQFSPHDRSKLAVAEKSGIIRFYDMMSLTAFMSVETRSSAVVKSMNWSTEDSNRIDVLCGDDWLLFDIASSCFPVKTVSVSSLLDSNKCGKRLKVLPGDSTLAAVSAGSGSDVTIFKSDPSALQQRVSRFLGCGFSWLNSADSAPCLVSGGDNNLIVTLSR